MIRSLLLVVCSVMVLTAPTALAGGIDLSYAGCPGNPGAVGGYGLSPVLNCASGDDIVLIGTWAPAQNISDLVALDGLLDYRVTGDLDLNRFWNFDPGDPSACGPNRLNVSQLRPSNCSSPGYLDIWNVANSGSALASIRRGPDVARIAFTCYRPTTVAASANQRLFGFQLIFDGSAASEAGGSCVGCCSQVEIIWVSGKPASAGASTPGELTGTTGQFPGFANAMTLTGTPQSCQPVPTRSRTWGQLKSLYR